jgi:hypothetical protein
MNISDKNQSSTAKDSNESNLSKSHLGYFSMSDSVIKNLGAN